MSRDVTSYVARVNVNKTCLLTKAVFDGELDKYHLVMQIIQREAKRQNLISKVFCYWCDVGHGQARIWTLLNLIFRPLLPSIGKYRCPSQIHSFFSCLSNLNKLAIPPKFPFFVRHWQCPVTSYTQRIPFSNYNMSVGLLTSAVLDTAALKKTKEL
jgi:hypothetical protein